METKWIASPRCLSDSELIDRVRHLAGRERQATAALIAHLIELDERRLYAAEGCASLFVYCTEILHLSGGAAYNRIEAAKAARKFPVILEKLADGSVHLAAIRLLVPHLTDENHRDLLEAATHRSKRDVERLIARIRPRAAVPSSVRRVPAAAATIKAASESIDQPEAAEIDFTAGPPAVHQPDLSWSPVTAQPDNATAAGNAIEGATEGGSRPAAERPARAKEVPLSADLYSVHFTADAETYTALCQARELLRHRIPDGDAAAVIGMALRMLVERLKQQKFAERKRRASRCGHAHSSTGTPELKPAAREVKPVAGELKPAAGEPKPTASHAAPGKARRRSSRHIPAEVKRRVWTRDDGRCAFVAHTGRRCTERGMLEFHHVEPFAVGGAPTVPNIELRCRAHNRYEAELCFGRHPLDHTIRRERELAPGRVENVIFTPG